ncbi:hypothetical protein HRbin39_00477 [bacterium HR39]|nr:hypothetical protein HRbin39_00477 [bacterium HR39]
MPKADRLRVIDEILGLLCSRDSNLRIFAACVDKTLVHEDPVETAFEHICLRFDKFLQRVFLKRNDPQRGVVVLDKTRRENRLQTLASGFRITGHRWGIMRNLAEVPLFADSRATRLLQIADIVTYVVWRRYERNEPEFVDRTRRLLPCFDQDGPALHGLIHVPNRSDCLCPACAAQRGENWRL